MRQVGLTSLRLFLAVCEEGSIAKAAEREFIVASAVSKRVAEMEEMLGVGIMEGSLFYGEPRRRTAVQFDSALRDRTERLAARMHGLYEAGVTPQGVFEKKCKSCSLIEVCKPEQSRTGRSAIKFLARQLDEIGAEEP